MATKTRLQVAAELLEQGRLREAKTRLVKELRSDPRSVAGLQLLGAVAFGMSDHDEAIDYLQRASRLAPSSPGPWLNLGKALLDALRPEEAAAALEHAVRHWPDIAVGRFSYGNALLALGKLEQAAEEFRAAIRLAPDDPGPFENLALVL